MSSLEQALDQHLRLADQTYDEWEYYDEFVEPTKPITNVEPTKPVTKHILHEEDFMK